MISQGPGKIILSGEHSVVYGAPALALATLESITAKATPAQDEFSINLEQQFYKISPTELSRLKQQLDNNYQQFEQGQRPIEQVLEHPSQLLFYCLSLYPDLPVQNIQLTSSLPMGAGMGSSAAAIAALLVLSEALIGCNSSLSERCQKVRYIERLQHGRGSLLDAAAVSYGGLVQVQNDQVQKLPIKTLDGTWYKIYTGRPQVSTGVVVAEVARAFSKSHIWSDFTALTQSLALELSRPIQNSKQISGLIAENHQLLCQLGVVPEHVQNFIAELERLGGAAKISGAGSNLGAEAGLVLAYLPESIDQAGLGLLLEQYNYQMSAVIMNQKGAKLV